MTYLPTPAAAAARHLYLPNGLDVWGFDGALATRDTTSTTDTTIGQPDNMRAGGYTHAEVGTSSAFVFNTPNGLASRQNVAATQTGNASGNTAYFIGRLPLSATARYVSTQIANAIGRGYTKWVLESHFVVRSLVAVDVFAGAWDLTGADPVAATARAVGLLFQPSVDATNWLAYANSGTAATKSSSGVAAATTAVTRVKVELSQGSLTVTVNGTAVTVATNLPTQLLVPHVGIVARTTGTKDFQLEWLFDRYE